LRIGEEALIPASPRRRASAAGKYRCSATDGSKAAKDAGAEQSAGPARRRKASAYRAAMPSGTGSPQRPLIDGLEVEDYRGFEAAVIADYDAETAVERELVLRLASLLWRLRRIIAIETDLGARSAVPRRRQQGN